MKQNRDKIEYTYDRFRFPKKIKRSETVKILLKSDIEEMDDDRDENHQIFLLSKNRTKVPIFRFIKNGMEARKIKSLIEGDFFT